MFDRGGACILGGTCIDSSVSECMTQALAGSKTDIFSASTRMPVESRGSSHIVHNACSFNKGSPTCDPIVSCRRFIYIVTTWSVLTLPPPVSGFLIRQGR